MIHKAQAAAARLASMFTDEAKKPPGDGEKGSGEGSFEGWIHRAEPQEGAAIEHSSGAEQEDRTTEVEEAWLTEVSEIHRVPTAVVAIAEIHRSDAGTPTADVVSDPSTDDEEPPTLEEDISHLLGAGARVMSLGTLSAGFIEMAPDARLALGAPASAATVTPGAARHSQGGTQPSIPAPLSVAPPPGPVEDPTLAEAGMASEAETTARTSAIYGRGAAVAGPGVQPRPLPELARLPEHVPDAAGAGEGPGAELEGDPGDDASDRPTAPPPSELLDSYPGSGHRERTFQEGLAALEDALEVVVEEDDEALLAGFQRVSSEPGLYEIQHPTLGVIRVRFEEIGRRRGLHIELESRDAVTAFGSIQWDLRMALSGQGFDLLSISAPSIDVSLAVGGDEVPPETANKLAVEA